MEQTVVEKENFDRLSAAERAVVGEPGDYDWEHPIDPPPAKRRGRTAQFSLRADQRVIDALSREADERGVSFSDVVREALEGYLEMESAATHVTAVYSVANAKVILHGNQRAGWSATHGTDPQSLTARGRPDDITPSVTGLVT